MTNVNEAPTVTSGATGTVPENAVAGTVVYTVTGSDVDAATTLVYSLSGTDAALFNIDSANGALRLNSPANFEAKNSYSLDVIASDGALSDSRAITVNVTDVLEGLLLDGTAGADSLLGSLIDDTINGLDGNDTLDGAGGADSMNGGLGFDSLIGGTGNDTLRGADQADTLRGGEGNDYLYGGKGLDSLDGGIGNDQLFGLVGNDTLLGFDGADWLEGGDGNDSLSGGLQADTLLGGIGTDWLGGGKGFDSLDGGDGNDTLNGGLGTDTFTGGAGLDHFVFGTLLGGTNIDTITDFVSGVDVINLSATIFTAYAGLSGTTVGMSDNLQYDSGSGALSYDADGAGGAAAVQFAILGIGVHPASPGSDFLIIA